MQSWNFLSVVWEGTGGLFYSSLLVSPHAHTLTAYTATAHWHQVYSRLQIFIIWVSPTIHITTSNVCWSAFWISARPHRATLASRHNNYLSRFDNVYFLRCLALNFLLFFGHAILTCYQWCLASVSLRYQFVSRDSLTVSGPRLMVSGHPLIVFGDPLNSDSLLGLSEVARRLSKGLQRQLRRETNAKPLMINVLFCWRFSRFWRLVC